MAADITAIILTKNEEVNIEECIKSIITTVKRIVVIDSFSTDKTVEIAKRMGAEVYQHPFENYAKQYMYGVEVAKAETVWTLRIDADERLTPDSANELTQLCDSNMKTDVTGIVLRFKKNFLGKDLYHGGVYPCKTIFWILGDGKIIIGDNTGMSNVALCSQSSISIGNRFMLTDGSMKNVIRK